MSNAAISSSIYSGFVAPIAAGFLSGKYKRGSENETTRTKTYPVMKERYFSDADFDVVDKQLIELFTDAINRNNKGNQ